MYSKLHPTDLSLAAALVLLMFHTDVCRQVSIPPRSSSFKTLSNLDEPSSLLNLFYRLPSTTARRSVRILTTRDDSSQENAMQIVPSGNKTLQSLFIVI